MKNEEILNEKARKTSIIEGSCYSVSDGFGLRNITPYLLEIGKNNPYTSIFVGLISSVPSLIANISQVFSARLMERYSRKRIVSFNVFLQSILWLAMLIPGFLYFYLEKSSMLSSILLLIIYSSLVVAGSIAGPAWISWMRSLTPDSNKRGRYFGKRNKIAGTVSLIFALAGGFILDYYKQTHIFIAFIILFGFSFVFRSISGYLFLIQHEPAFKLKKDYYFSFKDFVKKMPFNNFGRFTIFIGLFGATVAIASPFFAVYMLKDLGLTYTQYTIITLSSALTALLSMPLWGRFSDIYGSLKTIKITGFFIPLIPFLWLPTIFLTGDKTTLIITLIILEAVSGFLWAGFNLATSNFIFSAVTNERIAICTSYHNLINASLVLIATLTGGYISSLDIGLAFPIVLLVFFISGIFRWIVYSVFINKINEVRQVKPFSLKKHMKEQFGKKLEKMHIYYSNLNLIRSKEKE